MKLKRIRPVLWTRELLETIEFYKSKLGFICLSFDESWGWASLRRDAIEIMVSLPNDHFEFKQSEFTGSLYIDVEDVSSIWEELKDKVEVCYPIESFEYGMKEFAVYDNNGYIIQFGEVISV